jgi:hypothetical protein
MAVTFHTARLSQWLLFDVADEKGVLLNLERIEGVIVRRERLRVCSSAGVGVAEETSAQ